MTEHALQRHPKGPVVGRRQDVGPDTPAGFPPGRIDGSAAPNGDAPSARHSRAGDSREPSCVRRPNDALRHPPHSHRAADAMSRVDRARWERHSRSLTSRLGRAAAGVASSAPGFLLRPLRAVSLAAPLALLLAALAFAQPATAQTIVELVGNDGQTSTDAHAGTLDKYHATSFTTGNNAEGYVLTRADVHLKKNSGSGVISFAISLNIYTDASGVPGTWIGLGKEDNVFGRVEVSTYDDPVRTAPAGINLDANTKYWVAVQGSSSEGDLSKVLVAGTSSDGEDSTGLSGWSIGNHRLWRARTAGSSWSTTNTDENALGLELRGRAIVTPSAPTGLTVSAGTNSGELDASWTAPSGTVTDYDLRYYEGAADPTDAADWVEEHETNGLGTGDSTATSATIKGLKANTAYRVQVRAGNADREGAWSASVAGMTNAASGTNNAPKAMTLDAIEGSCKLWTDTSQPAQAITAAAGTHTRLVLTTRGTETVEWPTSCTRSGNRKAPVFDDQDGVGDLYFTMRYTAANVRGFGGSAPFSLSKTDEGRHLLNAAAVAIGSATGVRVDLTARDEHGASASAWVRFDVGVMPNAVGAPAFGAQVPDQTADTGTAFSLVLPKATGGDVSRFSSAINSPYTYAVSGLPAGLSFDAATRRVSGTPRASGTFTVTYTADDADALYSLKASPGPADTADVASQTFTIQVTGPAPPPTAPLLLSARVSSDGTKLTLYYDQELDPNSAPAHAHFSANIAGTGRALPVDASPAQRDATPVTVSGSTVTITLALHSNNGLTAGQTVAMGYNAANADANPIKNLAGLKAPKVSALAVINDVGATGPAVTISSAPTHDTDGDSTKDTYGAGARIRVSLTYDEPVTVDTSRGTPRLKIGFGGGNHKWAVYESGSGGQTLRFAYTVVSGDTSTEGVAVVANTLELMGGIIRPASLELTALANDSDHMVDATLDAQPPRFESATVDGTALWITFDEILESSVHPASSSFHVDARSPDGSVRRIDGGSIGGVNAKRLLVTLGGGVSSGESVTVNYAQPGSRPLQDEDGNAVESFSGEPVTNNTGALSDPTNLKVVATTLGGSLTVTWTAPTTATTTAPTGYGLRYYAGTEDPPAGREADWKEDVAGLPDVTDGTTETATIEGLKANTAYRVQLRAKYTGFNGPWSASESGTTGSPAAGNNAPRALKPSGNTGNVCAVETGGGAVKGEWMQRADGGTLVSQAGMVAPSKRTDDGNWPTVCVDTTPKWVPKFDDVDGDKLTLSVEPTPVPDNVRVNPKTYFWVEQPGDRSTIHSDPASAGRVFFQGQAAFRDTAQRAVRTKVTATDPHGASVTVRVVYIVDAVRNDNGAPSLPEVPAQNASPGRAFSLVLPPASGGDNFVSTLTRGSGRQYYYAISGLPEGLTFDPETRTISGTPSETGPFTVTYIADDPDTVGSAYLNPEETDETKNAADVASRTFTINVKPFIDLVRVTSAPTHDANGDGRNDTYTKDDKIVFNVEFTEPVKVDGEGADGTNVRLRLDIGPNGGGDAQRDANREVAFLTDVFHGGKTLRFTYKVEGNSLDPDGVFVQTFGDDGKVVTLRPGATIKGLVSKLDADLTRTDFITGNAVGEDGIPMSYVNGWATAAGPMPTSASVNGKTLTVTINEDLAALSADDLEALQLHFSVQGAGDNLGNRNAFQHPSQVGTTADDKVLGLTLGVAARAGEKITLTYGRFDNKGPLKDGDGNLAPAFVEFVVKNDTGGGTVTGTLVSNTGQSNDDTASFDFDRAQEFTTGSNTDGYKLTSVAVPYDTSVPGANTHQIRIHASNSSNRPADSLGTLSYGSMSALTVTYTASGEGIDLDAGTKYFVVFDSLGALSGPTTKSTNSDSEDSGAAGGWSLANPSLWKSSGGTSWADESGIAWQIAIDGVVIGATNTKDGPRPQSASVAGTELKIVFDKALDETSSESGQHFEVSANDPNDPKGERVETAGTAADVAVSGDTVTVTLAEAVPPGGAASVTYDPPTLSLKAAEGNGRVARFEGFKIETVYDKTVPVLVGAAVVQTSKNPDGFRVVLYYDEALDPESVPAIGDFSLTLDSNAAVTPNAVALEGSAVVLTVDLAKAPGDEAVDQTYTEADVSYTKVTDPIRDLAGNEAAAFTGLEQSELEAKVDVEAAGTPAVVPVTVLADAKLVGNTAQSGSSHNIDLDLAQAFTTGSASEGYTLTSVTVPYSGGVPAESSHEIRIQESTSSNLPSDRLGTLSYGTESGSTVTYTASGDGIDLDPGTTYFVIVDVAATYSDRDYQRTNSDSEDAGGADGWSLANGSLWRTWNTGVWNTTTLNWQIAIHGKKPVSVPGLRAEGARLTMTYDKSLDPASVPGPERFRVLHDAGLGEEVEYGRVTGVTVEGKEALLRTGFEVYPCAGATPFTLTYASSDTDKNLRTMTGELAPDIEAAAVTNTRAGECGVAGVSGNSGGGTGQGNQGKSLSLKFDRPLDTGKALKASLFGLAGASAPAVAGAAYSADGTAVVLTLERALGSGETVTVGYTRRQGEPGLWDADGKQLADFSGVEVTAPEVAVVTGVEVVSDSGEDGTYALGETVRVRVTFSEAVEMDTAGGTPRLNIDLDPAYWGTKPAAYEGGSGTAELVFAYEVVQPNESTQGIAVLADTLEANGCTIRAAADGKDVRLSHTGLGHDPAHKVDWRLTPPPAGTVSVTAVAVVSDAGDDDTYGLGDRIRVQVTFDEAVSVTGAPRLKIDMDPAHWGGKWATYEGGDGTTELTFAYEVAQPNESTGGIAVLANTLELNGGTVRSASGNVDAHLSHAGLGHDPAHKIDWQLTPAPDTTAPVLVAVSAVRLSSSPASGDTYALGETIRVSVAFDGAVQVSGSPRLTIDMDPAAWGEHQAVYESGSGTSSLTFAHTVVQPNESTQGVAVLADTLEANGGTIRSTSGTDADLSHAGLGHDAAHKVDWRSGLASVTAVTVSSTPASGDTYLHGETIRLTVAFDKAVTVSGAPHLKIDMDPAYWGEKLAAYEGGSGTGSLTFAHAVVEPNLSTQGIAVLANTLEAGGGAILTAGTSLDADLAHTGLGHDAAHKVDWRPTLSVADAEAHEGEDAAMEFAVTLSRPASGTVTVDYATADGTATAGEDYTATTGTLTFSSGEQTKTISVPLIDDAIDEGQETFTLTLSNASRARILDGEATGTIINSDHMPKAWTSRFGRTVAVHVVDAVEARLEGAAESYLQLGGQRLGGGSPPDVDESAQRLAPERDLWEEPDPADMPGQDMTPSQLLLGTAFHLVSEPGEGSDGPRLSAWGRVASSGFDGREEKLSLSGTVTTATLGVDGVWERWLSGLLLAYSEGDGSFTHLDLPGGDVSSSLTSLHPYVAYTLSDRVRLWGTVGYGSGALRLSLEDQRTMDTDLTMTMGALGVRGSLLKPSGAGGLQLDLRSDVLWMVMDSAKADNLAATEAEASRLRLVLQGSRPVALAGGGSFTPSVEIGLRHDGGDAETGTGVEVGGSLRYASAWGLSIEASLRALVAHEEQDYREWGASGALRFDPGQQGRGLTAAIVPTWGTAASGISRLWDQSTAAGLAPDSPLAQAAAEGRLEAELGYGLLTLKGRALLTPYARVALVESADQAWHLGTRLALAESLNLSVEASRRQRAGDVPAHELALRAVLGW